MGVYRTICVSFWTDPKVVDFSAEDRYIMLYLLTNPHANITGCFEINFRQMAFETGHSVESIICIIKRLAETHKIIQYCQDTSEILILNWYRYNWSGGSPNVIKAVVNAAGSIKNDRFRDYVLLKANSFGKKEERSKEEITVNSNTVNSNSNIIVDIGYEYPIDRVSEKDSKKTKKHVNKPFTKPTIEEIAEYCHERNNTVDPEAFYAFYESVGWLIGKKPMKNWKMAVITWEKNNYGNSTGKRGSDPYDVRNQYWDENDPTVH